jgi:hypothetical protein
MVCKRTLDNAFIIKTIVCKYLREKKEAEFTGVLYTSRKLSIHVIEKLYGLR